MTGGRLYSLVRGLGALAATLALLGGVPLVLAAAAGWPLPTSLPGLESLERATRTGIEDDVIVNILAAVAWFAWAQIALSILVEVVAVVRCRPALHLPVLPGVQVTAARLVTGIVLLVSPLQPAAAAAASPALPVAPHEYATAPGMDDLGSSSWSLDVRDTAARSEPVPDDLPRVVVQRHDSYWAIAERTLGDGLRWHEIRDLNVGRSMADGSVIAAGDDVLLAGWLLVLPSDAVGAGSGSSPAGVLTTPSGESSSVVVAPGDHLWALADGELSTDLGREATDAELAPYWREVIDANHDRFVEAGNPNLILPGQVLLMPPTRHEPEHAVVQPTDPGPPPSAGVEPEPPQEEPAHQPPSTASPTTEVSSTAEVTDLDVTVEPQPTGDTETQGSSAEDSGASSLPLKVTVGGLSSVSLAVGLKRLLARRRRRFAHAHGGRPARRPAPEQRELHQTLIAEADEDTIDDLQRVLGWLATSLAQAGAVRRPRMVQQSPDSTELLLDSPETDAPPGWSSVGGGTVWTLEQASDLDEALDGPACPAPLLVTVGQPEDGAQLYLDLEVDGLIELTGDVEVARKVARSMVTELALAPLADTLRVIVVGDLVDHHAVHLDHLTTVASWDEVTGDVATWATESHGALAENGWPNAFIARGHDPGHDALVPIAVIATTPPPPDLLHILQEHRPSAVAVVVAGPFDGAAGSIRCEVDALHFDAVGLACAPQQVDVEELAEMGRLLLVADSPDEHDDGIDAEERPAEAKAVHESLQELNGEVETAGVVGAPGCDEPPAFDILVRLLGDIRIEGGRDLNPKPTAVVAYLAIHRSVTSDRLEEACWVGSEGTSHRKRLRDVMTECRDALGSQYLPANRSGTYVVAPSVATDVELFDWHVSRAADREPAEALECYRRALDLVTGKPFSYPTSARASFSWVDFEHHATTWEYRVARVAQSCAEMHLDVGAPDEAITLLRRIVQAVPLNSAVVETLMRAHIASGDRPAAEHVYQAHRNSLAQAKLGDPDDAIELLRFGNAAT